MFNYWVSLKVQGVIVLEDLESYLRKHVSHLGFPACCVADSGGTTWLYPLPWHSSLDNFGCQPFLTLHHARDQLRQGSVELGQAKGAGELSWETQATGEKRLGTARCVLGKTVKAVNRLKTRVRGINCIEGRLSSWRFFLSLSFLIWLLVRITGQVTTLLCALLCSVLHWKCWNQQSCQTQLLQKLWRLSINIVKIALL